MAQRKTQASGGPERAPQFKGHRKVVVSLKDSQAVALVAEARRRADERGAIRADVSEIVRELVDAWMNSSKKH
jgi:hypothetical protein